MKIISVRANLFGEELSIEASRMRCIEVFDDILRMLDRGRDIRFELESAAELGDYLELRPERTELIKKYVLHGNILFPRCYYPSGHTFGEGETFVEAVLFGESLAKVLRLTETESPEALPTVDIAALRFPMRKYRASNRIGLRSELDQVQSRVRDALQPLFSFLVSKGEGIYPEGEFHAFRRGLLGLRRREDEPIRDNDAALVSEACGRMNDAADELERRGLEYASDLLEYSGRASGCWKLTAFNPTEDRLTGVAEFEAVFPVSEAVSEFRIADGEGSDVPCAILSHNRRRIGSHDGNRLPCPIETDRFRALILLKDLPPVSVKGFTLIPNEAPLPVRSKDGIENEFYRIETAGGRVDLFCKKSGVTICDAIRIEDRVDRGSVREYVPGDEPAVFSDPDRANVTVSEDNALRKSVRIDYTMRLPKRYDFDRRRASESRMFANFGLTLTLKKGCEVLELSYSFDNRAEDHRLRLGISSAIASETLLSDSAFDCGEHGEGEPVLASSFAAVCGGGRGFAVFSGGTEAELSNGTIWLTLLRATGIVSRSELDAEVELPENQCRGECSGRIGLYGFAEESAGQLSVKAKGFRTGLLVRAEPMEEELFGFSPRSQAFSQEWEQLSAFDRPADRNGDSAYVFGNRNIAVSAFKAAEDGNGLILRLVNLSENGQRTKLMFPGEIFKTDLTETAQKRLGRNAVELDFKPKQIMTLRIKK